MSALNDFLDEERALIVSMPVRIGTWVSQADDAPGTSRDDEREALAMERALTLIVSKTDDDRFINDVAEFALTNRAEWAEWQGAASTALDDLPKALSLVDGRLTAKDGKDYRSALYRVAGVVAQAASESGTQKDSGVFGKFLDRLTVKTDMSEPDNISAAEKEALQKLLACLKGGR